MTYLGGWTKILLKDSKTTFTPTHLNSSVEETEKPAGWFTRIGPRTRGTVMTEVKVISRTSGILTVVKFTLGGKYYSLVMAFRNVAL